MLRHANYLYDRRGGDPCGKPQAPELLIHSWYGGEAISIAIGDPVSGGTAHSILFVGPGTVLAQDNTSFKWNTTDKTLLVNGAGAKFGSFTAMYTGSNATSSTNNAIKTALSVTSIGNWNGTNAENRAIYASASGGPADANYAGFFKAGDVVLQDGRIGGQELKPTAKLHLGAGSASPGTAAFKLNAGAKLAIPEAGAIEFDGTYAFITRSDGTRKLLTNNVVDIFDFGAVGDGNADEQAAFQNAVTSLVATGGVIVVQPGKRYAIGSKVLIRSNYPIWIVSRMFNHHLPGAVDLTFAEFAIIRPRDDLDYMFEWDSPSLDPEDFGGGGGIDGICFADWTGFDQTANKRQFTIEAAVHIKRVIHFTFRDTSWYWLKGRAVQYGAGTIIRHDHTYTYACGDSDTNPIKPCHDIGDGTNNCALWAGDFAAESNLATAIQCNTNSSLLLRDFYFENGAAATSVYVDATNGVAQLSRGHMNANGATSIILGATGAAQNGSSIEDVSINNFPGAANPHIKVLSGAAHVVVNNLRIFGHADHSGESIDWIGPFGQLSNLHLNTCGRIGIGFAAKCEMSNIYFHNPTTEAGQFAIEVGEGSLRGAFIDGVSAAPCHGIWITEGSAIDCEVRNLNGGNGIVSQTSGSVITNCYSHGHINGGTAFVFTNGNVAVGNKGYPTTQTAVAGAATLHAESGVITSEALTTAVGASYTLTLTDQLVAAGSRVQVSVSRGTEADSLSYQVQEVRPSAGSCVIVIKNTGSVPFGDAGAGGGTIKIAFWVQN